MPSPRPAPAGPPRVPPSRCGRAREAANTERSGGMLGDVTPDAVMRELAGLQALARSLVHGDADADDLLQETAIAAMAHPPGQDRPLRPWLATVLLNRW